MEITNIADLPWGTSPHHVATRFKDLGTEGATDGVKLLWVEIAPGGRIMLHAHGAEVFFVLEGQGRFTIDHEEQNIAPGDRIIVPRGRVQGITNTSPIPLRLLAMQPPSGSRYFGTKLADLLRRIFT
jgi:mannose-6-phosphate isomerase-like protein (cupin superfamily)